MFVLFFCLKKILLCSTTISRRSVVHKLHSNDMCAHPE